MNYELSDEAMLKLAKRRYPIQEAKGCLDEVLMRAEALTDLLSEAASGKEFEKTSMNPRMIWCASWAIREELADIRQLLEEADIL